MTTTATLTARYDLDASRPAWADISIRFGTDVDSAELLVSLLPKSYRARIRQIADDCGQTYTVTIGASLLPSEGNDRNEVGINRVRAAERKLAQLGYSIEFAPIPQIINSYPTREAFDAAIA